jgi:hypothetical protein
MLAHFELLLKVSNSYEDLSFLKLRKFLFLHNLKRLDGNTLGIFEGFFKV